MKKEKRNMGADHTEKPNKRANCRRSPYTDMGLTLSSSILIAMTVKGCIFGFTWSGIALPVIAGVYIIIYILFRTKGGVRNIYTTAFVILSCLLVWAELSSQKNIRPQMPVFHGAQNDTTVNEQEEELYLPVETAPAMQEIEATDTLSAASDSVQVHLEENATPEKEETDSVAGSDLPDIME